MEILSQSIATFPTTPWEPVRGLNVRALLDGNNVLALQQERTDVVNFTQEDSSKLASWLPRALHAKKVVFLPNVHQGKSLLPTGSVVLTGQKDWHQFAVNDCGCGMRLIQSHVEAEDLSQRFWDRMANALRKRRGGFGDMGGRSHFLTALVPQEGGHLVFLMHTGSRIESGLLDDLVDQPEAFEAEASRLQMWASDNRSAIHDEIETIFGNTQLLVDLPHNAYEERSASSREKSPSCPHLWGGMQPWCAPKRPSRKLSAPSAMGLDAAPATRHRSRPPTTSTPSERRF
jgi:hypothetical protein